MHLPCGCGCGCGSCLERTIILRDCSQFYATSYQRAYRIDEGGEGPSKVDVHAARESCCVRKETDGVGRRRRKKNQKKKKKNSCKRQATDAPPRDARDRANELVSLPFPPRISTARAASNATPYARWHRHKNLPMGNSAALFVPPHPLAPWSCSLLCIVPTYLVYYVPTLPT
ncbi:hypothetical protein LX36DRAFT_189192 [Colletotrichum falcatum]|nr:hypothetical protein LX36DRAFT_189192 [Colletotrichum falcatum]